MTNHGHRRRLAVVALTAAALFATLMPASAATALSQDDVRLDLNPRPAWDHRGVRYRIVNDSDRNVRTGLRYRLKEQRPNGDWINVNARRWRLPLLRVEAGEKSRRFVLHRCHPTHRDCTDKLRDRRYRLIKEVSSGRDSYNLRLRFRVW